MQRIIVGIAAAAATLGLMAACSSRSSGSITAPTTLQSSASSPLEEQPCSAGNCQFEAELFPNPPSQWHGETTPLEGNIPVLGHPGHLTVNFPTSFEYSATLKWDKFHSGNFAVCTIVDGSGATIYTVPEAKCNGGQGTFVVHPTVTTTYTFIDKENPDQSRDKWQTRSVTVNVPTTYDGVLANWVPGGNIPHGDDVDDGKAIGIYTGTAYGPLNYMTATLSGPAHAHCGLGGRNEYQKFTAVMSLVEGGTMITGTYDANMAPACTAAKGTFTLYREDVAR